MKKADQLKALEYLEEFEALYRVQAESLMIKRASILGERYLDERRELDSSIMASQESAARLSFVRDVLSAAMRTRGRPPIRTDV